jgi:hypothetical protein
MARDFTAYWHPDEDSSQLGDSATPHQDRGGDMTTSINGQKSAELVSAADVTEILSQAITAKMNGHIDDAQFNGILSGVGIVPSARRSDEYIEATAVPISSPRGDYTPTRWQLLGTWLRQRPVVGTSLVTLTLTALGIAAWAMTALVQVAWAWLGLHIVSVGVTIFIGAVVVLIHKTLTLKNKRADIDMVHARRPVVIRERQRGDES